MVEKKPRFLVLLATYNGEKYLSEQIATIIGQEAVELYLYIADDLSKDGTRPLLAEIAQQYDNINILEVSESSGSAGANFRRMIRAIPCDGFDFVAFADQDDIWHPQKLITAVKMLEASGAQGYSCAVEAFWSSGRRRVIRQCGILRGADYLFEGAGQGCTFVVTDALFREVRRFCCGAGELSESLHYHDWLIYLLARRLGFQWFFDSNPSISYRQHGNNEIGSRGGIVSVQRRLSLIKNGWYGRQVSSAVSMALSVGRTDPSLHYFSELFRSRRSIMRRLRLAEFVLRYGRRRLSDRLVLFFSSLAGWV